MNLVADPQRAVIIDRLDSRVLGAVRFADAVTGRWIEEPLEVTAPGVTFVRNRSGVLVISRAPGLDAHVASFAAPPAAPPLGSVPIEIAVADPAGRYLSRRVRIGLPRDPDPGHADATSSLFRAVAVRLFPAPAAQLFPGWAVLRVTVKRGATETGVPNAWLRLRLASQPTTADPPLGAGMTDARGEALVAVSGIPVTNWDAADDGPVLASEIDAVLEAYADVGATAPPDPDAIDGKRATLPVTSQPLKLASGRQSAVRLALTLP